MLTSVLPVALLCASALAVPAPFPAPTPAVGQAAHVRRAISDLAARSPRGFTSAEGVVHLPISSRRRRAGDLKRFSRRQSNGTGTGYAQVGLTDDSDFTYIVTLELGGQPINFQIGELDLLLFTGRPGLY